MAREELARFAARRTSIVAGHSIDRSEVGLLFSQRGGESIAARQFFGQFEHIDCFFASENEQFRSSLMQAARGEVCFYRFRPTGSGHVADCYLRAVGSDLSGPIDNSLELTQDDLRDAEQRLHALGLKPKNFVLVLPGSGSAKKNWPAENFALLAQRIQLRFQVLAVLGPAEETLRPVFQRLLIANNTQLGELAAMARLGCCFIGNDSGVSHLAAAAGARGLTIFGPTDPERWRPLGDVTIIRREPLKSLSPDLVWPAVAELMDVDP